MEQHPIVKFIEHYANQLDTLSEDEIDAPSDTLENKLLFFLQFKQAYEKLDEARKALYHVLDHMDKVTIPEALEQAGHEDGVRVRVTDELGYNFRRATKYSAKTIDKEKLFEWLREKGAGDIIVETVNAGTLASFLKEQMLEHGTEAPPDVAELKTYYGVGINKYTPKKG